MSDAIINRNVWYLIHIGDTFPLYTMVKLINPQTGVIIGAGYKQNDAKKKTDSNLWADWLVGWLESKSVKLRTKMDRASEDTG